MFVFAYSVEQDNFAFGVASEVDHPHTARLARSCSSPPHLANAAGPGHDITGAGMLCNIRSESSTFLFSPVVRPLALEQRRFDYGEHA
jgi:hypothetical protein